MMSSLKVIPMKYCWQHLPYQSKCILITGIFFLTIKEFESTMYNGCSAILKTLIMFSSSKSH